MFRPSPRSTAALYKDKFWGCFQGEKQMTVTFQRAFHRRCMQAPSLMGSSPSSPSLSQAGLCMQGPPRRDSDPAARATALASTLAQPQ